MFSNGISFKLKVGGKEVIEYHKDGKIFVEGRKNKEYTLEIYNSTSKRILAIPSVDGLSVLDGKPASKDSNGYVINPHSVYEIKGWRINNDEVRNFFFSRHDKSYSAKTEQGESNLGAIGLIVYKEKSNYRIFHTYTNDWYTENYTAKTRGFNTISRAGGGGYCGGGHGGGHGYDSISAVYTANCTDPGTLSYNSGSDSLAQELVEQTIGTGMGEKVESKVTTTTFDRENYPLTTFVMYYYEKRQLEQMGVVHKVKKNLPQAFPGNFCKEV